MPINEIVTAEMLMQKNVIYKKFQATILIKNKDTDLFHRKNRYKQHNEDTYKYRFMRFIEKDGHYSSQNKTI